MLYRLTNVTKTYRSGEGLLHAVHDVSLTIAPGEFIALTGVSGSGKSTLLNLLGLMDTPSGGELAFAGQPLAGRTDRELTDLRREAIGFVFQNFNLVPTLTARENVEYPLYLEGSRPAREIREVAVAALARVGMSAFAGHRPAELSGGQRQRVAIARAIVKSPKVILADEPTANLDSANAQQILELLRRICAESGATVILATHDPAIAASAPRVLRMQDGALLSKGAMDGSTRQKQPVQVVARAGDQPSGVLRYPGRRD